MSDGMNIAKSQHYSGEILLDDPGGRAVITKDLKGGRRKWKNKKQKNGSMEGFNPRCWL